MIASISTRETDRLKAKLRQIRDRSLVLDTELIREVTAIIEDVRIRGDAALLEYSRRFDDCHLLATDLRISETKLRESAARVEPVVRDALREAIANVRSFHEHERESSWTIEGSKGTALGQQVRAIDSAGCYVPGGSASYPSSVIMNVVPAQVAGVKRIVLTAPPRTISESPAVAAAICELGVPEVYAVGGAQAIAALAFGTESISPVDKITGPGNRYVAAAKRAVFGVVGIDSIAGPSEIVVLADANANARFVVADLLAQAEHSEDASAILISTSNRLTVEVEQEIEKQLATLPRREIIKASLSSFGAIITVKDLDEALKLVNDLAPEHFEIMTAAPEEVAAQVRNAGAIFFGDYSPEALGDYFAGPNHVLPTTRTARFASALGMRDFVKRINTVKYSRSEMNRAAPIIAALARAEGLEAHARSVLVRLQSE